MAALSTGRLADPASAGSRATGERWDMAAIDRDIAASLGFLEMDHMSEGEPGPNAMDDAALEQPAAGAAALDDALDEPQPLAAAVSTSFMSRMAHAFGQRFDDVRIHRDSPVPAGRQAFSRGHDIHLGPDAPAPDSPEAERILAHELAHVAQRGVSATAWQSRPPDVAALEVDAHQAALHALAGQAAAVRLAAPAGLALGYTGDPDAVDEGTATDQPPASQDDDEIRYLEYSVFVPESYTTLEQMYRLFERTVFGKEVNLDWNCGSYCDMSENRGTTVPFRIDQRSVDIQTDPDVKQRREQSQKGYQALTGGMRRTIDAEVDKRYYERSGDKPSTKIKKGEEGKARTWEQMLTEVMAEKASLEQLPPQIQDLMHGKGATFHPKDYPQLIRIAEKLKQFRAEDFAVYRLLAIRTTDDLDLFEKSVDMYLARKEELEKALDAQQQQSSTQQSQSGTTEPTLQDALDASWTRPPSAACRRAIDTILPARRRGSSLQRSSST
jgi:Domain of unknown function (DUF4157)